MAIKLLNLGSRHQHILSFDEDRPKPDPENPGEMLPAGPTAVVWDIVVLSSRVMGHLSDSATRFVQNSSGGTNDIRADMRPFAVAYERVRLGLKGVSNLKDDSGTALTVPLVTENIPGLGVQEVVAQSFMDKLPRPVILELSSELMKLTQATSDVLGN